MTRCLRPIRSCCSQASTSASVLSPSLRAAFRGTASASVRRSPAASTLIAPSVVRPCCFRGMVCQGDPRASCYDAENSDDRLVAQRSTSCCRTAAAVPQPQPPRDAYGWHTVRGPQERRRSLHCHCRRCRRDRCKHRARCHSSRSFIMLFCSTPAGQPASA